MAIIYMKLVHKHCPQHLCMSIIPNTCAWALSPSLVHQHYPQLLCMSIVPTLVHEHCPQHLCMSIVPNTCAWALSTTLVHGHCPQHLCMGIEWMTGGKQIIMIMERSKLSTKKVLLAWLYPWPTLPSWTLLYKEVDKLPN